MSDNNEKAEVTTSAQKTPTVKTTKVKVENKPKKEKTLFERQNDFLDNQK